jgi:hypothetical protein
MEDRDGQAGRSREQHGPERAGGSHDRGADDSRESVYGNRFAGDDGRDRGYRGQRGRETPPGAVPGGSYGGGGGYRQGGYDRGNYDPAVDMARGRGSWARARGDAMPQRSQPRAYGGLDEYRSRGRMSDSQGGDWRQGYGAYGMAESPRGGTEPSGMEAGEGMFGPPEEEQHYDYGFGGAGGEERGRGSGRWGVEGRPNRGSQGRGGWSGEQRWERERPRDGDDHGRNLDWPYLEPWAVPGPHTGRGPEGYQRSEEAIRNDVCERLTRHGGLDASRIRVLVEKGEVILEGRVESRTAKRMAEDTAESVMGVRDVQNRLRIEDHPRD